MKQVFLALLLSLSGFAFAGPAESVDQTISELLAALRVNNDRGRVSALCSLVNRRVDTQTIGTELLGGFFGALKRDADGIRKFKMIVPSIIMDHFYGLMEGKGNAKYTVEGTTAKGSGRVGVKVVVDNIRLIVTVGKASLKVLDVEWNGLSLIRTKQSEIQRELKKYYQVNPKTSLPVTDYVKELERDGVNKCG
jgi:ABC-type transporter MlaC component